MTEHPALAWNKLIIEANGLGRRMKLLNEAIKANPAIQDEYDDLAGIYEEDPAELHRNLWGISAVLKIIGDTPNAYINAEGMAAIRAEVENAAIIERAATSLLDKIDPPIC